MDATRCPHCLKKFGRMVILQDHEKHVCSKHPSKGPFQVQGNGFGMCESCKTPLFIPGGYGGTGLCGPCCTGEAETLEEMGESW